MFKEQPWNEADATYAIRTIARSDEFDLFPTAHALEQMGQRNLIMGDVLNALKTGFVRRSSTPSTQDGFHKYVVEAITPNSSPREIGVVAIPDHARCHIKVVTVMWIDETANVAGSIIGE
ncbi:DUF4258 domain-containing protein [Thiosulfatihalobacter marinus]|uniref:DUF4258 domain-containing protein n=1 Tax=Thiosulfatihalobacter marinus TaxID=2792481 RepID=UPI0018D8079B|nr:DUF4258 domain-containing protein [Thiosulfatihalobacter marinus]